ncbi:MAG: Fic family protein [Bacteroidia bacterium]|jgi:Fic family protein
MIFGGYIASWREAKGISVLDFSMATGIDRALISKYERGKRLPSENHLTKMANAMDLPLEQVRKEYLADKIAKLLEYEVNPGEILMAAEDRMEYLVSKKALELPPLSTEVKGKLEAIDILHEQWNSLKPLNATQLRKMNEYFETRYTYESNRIEGNTLTYQETHLVVAEGLTIGGKSLAEHLEAINHTEAIAWLRSLVAGSDEVNRRNVLDLHSLVLKSIDSDNAGRYRSVPVRIGGSEHKPPEPFLLDKLMEDYYKHYMKQKQVLHPVILAAEMHERLVSIHPFIDGNGRTSRLLMNFILLKNGYTIANLKGDYDSRMGYYKALESVQADNNPEPFYHLILDKVKESLEEHLAMV